jgi:hypothetical protein
MIVIGDNPVFANRGDLRVDKNGVIFVCYESGVPGKWLQTDAGARGERTFAPMVSYSPMVSNDPLIYGNMTGNFMVTGMQWDGEGLRLKDAEFIDYRPINPIAPGKAIDAEEAKREAEQMLTGLARRKVTPKKEEG